LDSLPDTWAALCALALLLGARHGLDADHLATIDGLTRYNARTNARLARAAGMLFSLGHGAIVMLIALVTGALASGWQAPAWLEATGVAVSVSFLFGLAFLNVRAVVVTHPDEVVAPAGIKGRWLGRFITVQKPWAVAAVGALFAISFDTVTQATLFALAGSRFGGIVPALAIAALFVIGMLTVDGVNGLWIHRLIRRADRTARVASRVMALGVAALSFAIGLLTVAKIVAPALDPWLERHDLAVALTVIGGMVATFVLAMLAARRQLARGAS
jgi:high-affinity nickel-transport protein